MSCRANRGPEKGGLAAAAGPTGVDIIECFNDQMRSGTEEIQSNDLEWDTEEMEANDMSPTEMSIPEPITGHDEEEEYRYDCLQLKDRLTEIDEILRRNDRDLSADRYVISLPSLPRFLSPLSIGAHWLIDN